MYHRRREPRRKLERKSGMNCATRRSQMLKELSEREREEAMQSTCKGLGQSRPAMKVSAQTRRRRGNRASVCQICNITIRNLTCTHLLDAATLLSNAISSGPRRSIVVRIGINCGRSSLTFCGAKNCNPKHPYIFAQIQSPS
jgi:hypothetical protein